MFLRCPFKASLFLLFSILDLKAWLKRRDLEYQNHDEHTNALLCLVRAYSYAIEYVTGFHKLLPNPLLYFLEYYQSCGNRSETLNHWQCSQTSRRKSIVHLVPVLSSPKMALWRDVAGRRARSPRRRGCKMNQCKFRTAFFLRFVIG